MDFFEFPITAFWSSTTHRLSLRIFPHQLIHSFFLKAGYRLIDTAKYYRNEVGVGKALATSNVLRGDLFITTKLWNADQGYENTLKILDGSLEKFGLDYIDLYLIHWPTPMYVESHKALETFYKDGLAKAIGVCKFDNK